MECLFFLFFNCFNLSIKKNSALFKIIIKQLPLTNTSFQFPLILPLTINPLASEILFFSLSNSGL